MQALQNWSETMRKEDELEKEVLKKLTDPLQVQFLPFSFGTGLILYMYIRTLTGSVCPK